MHNLKYAFRQTDEKVVIEFKTAGELYSAYVHPIHFNKYQIRGTPRGADWIKHDTDLKSKHVKRSQHNCLISKRGDKEFIATNSLTQNVDNREGILVKSITFHSATGSNKIPIMNNRLSHIITKGISLK